MNLKIHNSLSFSTGPRSDSKYLFNNIYSKYSRILGMLSICQKGTIKTWMMHFSETDELTLPLNDPLFSTAFNLYEKIDDWIDLA